MEFEDEKDMSREELLRRLALMEAMIAEGRKQTGRCGWIFVLWGLVSLAGMALEWTHPGHVWNWPVVIGIGVAVQYLVLRLLRRSNRWCMPNLRSRALWAVWSMMGVTMMLYCFTAIFTRHAHGSAYFAGICFIVGLAHAISSMLLRWPMQGAAAALWWAGGVASFFVSGQWFSAIFCAEMLFGMVLFGIYLMMLERRTPPSQVAHV
jgi:hypothetical protein